MDGNEITESAKAVQELAKTTKAGIEATEKLGGFVSRIIGEPVDAVVGILTDKLKFMRWERQNRLRERANEIISQKNIEGELRTIPPKIALPIIENASLEENDELQDLWACLIASAVDPNFDGSLRTAFIDIIKQLEVNDVHILNYIYNHYLNIETIKRERPQLIHQMVKFDETAVNIRKITKELIINKDVYEESIDNLIRVRCVTPFISNKSVDIPSGKRTSQRIEDLFNNTFRGRNYNSKNLIETDKINFNIIHSYDKVCITPLGISFAKACMSPKSEED